MDVVEEAARLRKSGVPHVLATVVQARQPSSGKPGDRAVVTADRRVAGWVGGACTESVVAEEAMAALASGRARYLVLDAAATEVSTVGDRVIHPLTCHSGGAIELFIEPFAPPLVVTVVGDSPVARVLADLCAAAGYDVETAVGPTDPAVAGYDVETAVGPGGPAAARPAAGRGSFVVVATMGRADEDVARQALLAGAPYVAVVASRRRAEALRAWLLDHDVPEEALEALHSPAGLDIGARGAAAVAVSILAEITAEHARIGPGAGQPGPEAAREAAAAAATPRDPVCGMAADAASCPTAEHEGRRYAFCGVGCRDAFTADPARYLEGAGHHSED